VNKVSWSVKGMPEMDYRIFPIEIPTKSRISLLEIVMLINGIVMFVTGVITLFVVTR
jgi:hypothetical protein